MEPRGWCVCARVCDILQDIQPCVLLGVHASCVRVRASMHTHACACRQLGCCRPGHEPGRPLNGARRRVRGCLGRTHTWPPVRPAFPRGRPRPRRLLLLVAPSASWCGPLWWRGWAIGVMPESGCAGRRRRPKCVRMAPGRAGRHPENVRCMRSTLRAARAPPVQQRAPLRTLGHTARTLTQRRSARRAQLPPNPDHF